MEGIWVFPKIGGKPPTSSILIGFSIIFTIHFGVPLFLETLICFPLRHLVAYLLSTPPFAGWASTRVASLQVFGQISFPRRNLRLKKPPLTTCDFKIEKNPADFFFNVKSEVVSKCTILWIGIICGKLLYDKTLFRIILGKVLYFLNQN